jgi:putative tryptophan/tyrosine transport system substrate-binding protein
VRRRDLLASAIATLVIPPLVAAAQPAKVSVVGVLVHEGSGSERFRRLFRGSLRELGYVNGQNIRFEFRSDDGQAGRLPALAAELVRLKVDVIVTWFTPAAIAAKQATREIPIVCAACGAPIGTGLVESLARPGGNVTGIAAVGADLSGKMVDLIRDVLPTARRVVALANAPDPFSQPFLDKIRLAGKATGTAIDPIMVDNAGELDGVFAAIAKNPPGAVIVQPSLPTKRVAQLALEYRIPAVCVDRAFAYDGGLMAYYSAEGDIYHRAAVLVAKILKGAKPADLPVERPDRFELVVNLKTAKALGLTVPPLLLAQADEVIE